MIGLLTPRTYARLWGLSVALLAAAFFICMLFGPSAVDIHHVSVAWPDPSVRDLRMLRVLSAALVGLALASAGLTLQSLLRNPLADPYVLGISSGSSVGVMLWLLLGARLYAVLGDSRFLRAFLLQGKMIPAVIGAIVTCVLVFALARSRRSVAGADSLTLLLVGVILSAINGAIVMVLHSFAPPEMQIDFMNYMMGSISNDVTWSLFLLAAAVVAAGYLPIVWNARALNIGTLSDVEATSMGVNIPRLRSICFVSASITTGAAIMLAGPIGFVGLICPHICRRIVGADHRKLTVVTPFCGALFLMLADTFVSATGGLFHGELPVGVITALCGGPFFLYLLRRRSVPGGGALE